MDSACLDDVAVVRCDRGRRGSCWQCVDGGSRCSGLSAGSVEDKEYCGIT
jgi:hypothetical protein